MKIGILTFHCAHNYGAVLQTYALQEYLKGLGHEVYVIDYRPDYITSYYSLYCIYHWFSKNPIRAVKKFISELFFLHDIRIERRKGFNDFISNYLDLYPYQVDSDFSDFDCIFLGSDQIWNSHMTGKKYDDTFFGVKAVCKVVAYAASSRSKLLTVQESEYMRRHLQCINAISVREETFRKLLQPLTEKKIYTALDPTLIAGQYVFERIAAKSLVRKPYVLIYEIEEHPEVYKIAKHIALQLDAELVELVGILSIKRMRIKKQAASPIDFVSYIKNAECVITTSFHGLAFSILFKKNFYALKQHNSADIRLESLLERNGLLDRFIEMSDKPCFSTIDYDKVDIFLKQDVTRSRTFITEALSSRTDS